MRLSRRLDRTGLITYFPHVEEFVWGSNLNELPPEYVEAVKWCEQHFGYRGGKWEQMVAYDRCRLFFAKEKDYLLFKLSNQWNA